jgi:DNA-binding NarL/FixJ family response regulator
MIRVVIADDHTIVREGLKQLLCAASDVEVLDEARDGHEVVRIVRESELEVLLLDLSMPGKGGRTHQAGQGREAQAQDPRAQHARSISGAGAIKAGASGYLTMTASTQLLSAIRKVAGGGAAISAEVVPSSCASRCRTPREPPCMRPCRTVSTKCFSSSSAEPRCPISPSN